ncbi:hypothetical protein GALL_496740 [mine drainage metagenome]|uniref:Uncharacterized protein n=1 Tax=mine drainage metagenome TaxID=410659 RepID=A0A1J5PLR5_9ZZZZ
MRQIEQLGAVFEHFHQPRFVQHRIGVRRTGQAGDAAGCGGLQFALQRGLVFESGLAQAGRQVHQAGADHQASGVDGLAGVEVLRRLLDADNPACCNIQVLHCIDIVFRVDQPAVLDAYLHAASVFPARMLMTAMRTAMP